jgi:FtsP/CotA-like multicopper oxidase with cupredoxin domain
MKKTLLPLVTALALLAMPVSQAMAAPKPAPPAANSGGQMGMSSSQMAASQPAMSGWDMVKMRTTSKMRAKAARNAKLKGKPSQAVAASSFVAKNGPDYFGTTPNYASSPMPHITWVNAGPSNEGTPGSAAGVTPVVAACPATSHSAGGNVILPVYDPATGIMTDPSNCDAVVTIAESPYLADTVLPATGTTPVIDPINMIPQLDVAKVSISGGIRKFIQPLTSLGAAPAGSLDNCSTAACSDAVGSYLPVAVADTTSYPGSDYYEIGLKDYYQKFSPDLPMTKLRGYYQINAPGGAMRPFYLGPIIVAQKGRAVRVKFVNNLPTGAGGDLFIPTDTTAMGAGDGPTGAPYARNRAELHLHGGVTPWISDGTPHQWTTPAGDPTAYPKGVSVYNVPDMADANAPQGVLTYYWTNQQSARLMFYHDHAYGMTRLNVYAGEAAGLVLTDPAEQALVTAGTIPGDATGIPLVIQDKTFVPDNTSSGYFPDGQLTDQDPTWDPKWGGTGSLWFPHVYMPNQNPYDNSGANAMGRWDYGPWFWPIFGTAAGLVHGEIPNPYADPAAPWEPPMIPGTPSTYTNSVPKTIVDANGNTVANPIYSPSDVSLVPESFVDTPVVNGVAYPYLNVDPKAYRFRILNAANDRFWNLQMYCSAYDMKMVANTAALAAYQAALTAYNANPAVVAYRAALAKYNADLAIYNTLQAQYVLDKAAYDTYVLAKAAWAQADALDQLNGTTLAGPPPTAVARPTLPVAPNGPPIPDTVPVPVQPAALVPGPMWTSTAPNAMPTNADAGEVPMVPAVKTKGFPGNWPTDGRAGGVPNPFASAGGFLQIGSEGGVLPNAVDVENQPVNYVYNRRDIIVLSISTHALLLGPAERADVIYDFSKAQAMGCTNVILYNDAPTPVPAFDPRNDYYTNNPDQTATGGTPSTLPGYGPDTRTIMQFRINGSPAVPTPFDPTALKAAIPALFAATQDKPIVPNTKYAAAYGPTNGVPNTIAASDVYSRIQSTSLQFNASSAGDVGSLAFTAPGGNGSGYAPTVTVTPNGTPPTTPAKLVPVIGANGRIASVTILNPGAGYAAAPTLSISVPIPPAVGPAPIPATAVATVTGGAITRVRMTAVGRGYTVGAKVTIDPSAAGATATATATVNMNTGALSALTLTDVGNGYTAAPNVVIDPGPYSGGVQATATATLASGVSSVNMGMAPKAIQELFEMDYGRMNATLGVELPFTNARNQTTLPLGFAEPTSEFLKPTKWGDTQIGTARDGTAIWKLTHNGVDTHVIHFHLYNVQLINRVGWDGAIRPPDDNELGWKESVRMNPLEDAIVAMRPVTPDLPFKIGDSIRSIDPTMPANHQMTSLDPLTGNAITFSNTPKNFGWEYVWHCHLLGHEENDMMRPIDYQVSPGVPTIGAVSSVQNPKTITVSWTNNANWQLTNFVVQRATNAAFTTGLVQTPSDKPDGAGVAPFGQAIGKATSFVDTTAAVGQRYYYRVRAESDNGYSVWSVASRPITQL